MTKGELLLVLLWEREWVGEFEWCFDVLMDLVTIFSKGSSSEL